MSSPGAVLWDQELLPPQQVHAGHLPAQVRWAAQAGCPLELRGFVGGEESVMR